MRPGEGGGAESPRATDIEAWCEVAKELRGVPGLEILEDSALVPSSVRGRGRLEAACAVLIGPEVADPLQLAEALHRQFPSLGIVIACFPDRHVAVREQWLISPFVATSTRCVSLSEPEHCLQVVRRTAHRVQQRKRHHQLLVRSQRELEEKAAPAPSPDALLEEIFERSPFGVLLVDAGDRVVMASRAARVLLGLAESLPLPSDLSEVVPAADLDRLRRCLHAARRQTEVSPPTLTIPSAHRDDRRVEVFVSGEASEPQLSGLLALFLLDVTEREAERQVRALNATLTEALARQTALAEELARSNRELDDFAALASHDLRSPMITVRSFALLLIHRFRGQLPDLATEYLHRILESVNRLDAMTKALLEISRVSRDEAGGAVEQVELGPLVHQVWEELIGDDPARSRLEVAVLPRVLLPPGHTARVIQNLLSNARRYSGADTPIRVSAQRSEGGWILRFADRGPGVPPEDRERIFEPFHRRSPEKGGFGLGLAIVRRIVEHWGGRVWVEPTGPEGGATFCVSVPDPAKTTAPAGA